MSLWTTIRRPVVGMAVAGPVGLAGGLAYDASQGEGFWASDGGQGRLGMPEAPGYNAAYTSDMALTPEIQGQLDAINLDTRGLDKYRAEALRSGPSNWQRLARQQSLAEEAMARENAVKGVRGEAAAGESALAMRGGATSGARERLQQNAEKNYLDLSQGISAAGGAARLGISAQDEANRMRELQALPGMELQALQPQFEKTKLYGQSRQYDIGNLIDERSRRQSYDMDIWRERQRAIAAENQARATEDSGK